MKKINVIVKEKTILELAENANKGDLIDLEELVQVDTSYLERVIDAGKDKIYESKLEAIKEKIYRESQEKINDLQQKLKDSQSQAEILLMKKENEIKEKLENQINELKIKIGSFEETKAAERLKLIAELNAEKDKALQEQKNMFEENLKDKENIINNLQRAKVSMNVKQTGEDLETWCNNEVVAYMQNGLFNCTWEKDNKVIKEEDETKGSKADYIFKIYADEKHNEDELLASVCLDMKDENPDSVNKKNNADYYKQLDKNREKKECKYAVLVSNLELDKPNVLPIYKVREYENMYVVRPGYLMVFLNMITSLTKRFADIILSKEVEMIELRSKLDLVNEFEDIKKTYLDKPLEMLEKSIEAISTQSEAIKKACKGIDDQCYKINNSFISQINGKLNTYEIKFNRGVIKKLEN